MSMKKGILAATLAAVIVVNAVIFGTAADEVENEETLLSDMNNARTTALTITAEAEELLACISETQSDTPTNVIAGSYNDIITDEKAFSEDFSQVAIRQETDGTYTILLLP